jgi:hypothetical protein
MRWRPDQRDIGVSRMIVLTRIACRALLWLVVVSAALACCEVAAWHTSARVLSDAAKPLPGLSRELCGPSLDEAIEQFNRRGPEWASPPDVVE